MGVLDLVLAAAAGAVCLAIAATLWAWAGRRMADARLAQMRADLSHLGVQARGLRGAIEVFDTAVIAIEASGPARLVAGEETLLDCARVLGCPPEAAAVVHALGA